MNTGIFTKVIAVVLAGVFFISTPAAKVQASGSSAGKYVSDVYIAYGKNQEEANKWLTDNGWEPISGDNNFTAGKASAFDSDIVTAMGIKRTDNVKDAITDMAVMNMKGGYSLPDYQALINEKKADIDEFINNFIVVIQEYRDNYNNNGSTEGKMRADLVHDMLNDFIDGEEGDPNAVNDTHMLLGDLFLQQTRQEGNEAGGDLQQIMLESSGAAVLALEIMIAMAADTSDTTWIERLAKLSENEIAANIGTYVPDMAGQDLAPSAVTNILNGKFGDAARTLAEEWSNVHNTITEYEAYNEEHDLWQHDGEDDEAYAARVAKYFEDLNAEDEERYNLEAGAYQSQGILYVGLYNSPYSGEWGETLGDFFNPADGSDYSAEPDKFLPMAAALSEGQKASLDFLSLNSLIYIGLGDAEALKQAEPELSEEMRSDGTDAISVYTGVKREAFRGGVALTSQALMEQNMGRGAAFDKIWDNTGMVAMISYVTLAVGFVTAAAGTVMAIKGIEWVGRNEASYHLSTVNLRNTQNNLRTLIREGANEDLIKREQWNVNYWKESLDNSKGVKTPTQMGIAGRWMIGIGGALMIGAAIVKAVQLYKYYQRTFTPIPLMIVDESDIVSYSTDQNGNEIKNIEFNTYEYYDAVKCNRQAVGKLSDWQDGVEEYAAQGCGDVADLNGDFGQEWLALYTVKSETKGKPILADSIKLQYGSDAQPSGTTGALHMFEAAYAVDLGDTAYSYNNDKNGVYLFWGEDEGAGPATASSFSGGFMALAAAGGLLVGVLVTTLVLLPKRKKEEV